MTTSILTLSIATLAVAGLTGAVAGSTLTDLAEGSLHALRDVTKRCVFPDDHVDIVGPRFNADGEDILNSCADPSDRWGIRTHYDGGEQFDTSPEIARWCSQEGQFLDEFQAHRDPGAACRWSYATTVSWIDHASS